MAIRREPAIVSVEMGYGHLRAAHSLARAMGVPVLRADQPPMARDDEVRIWDMVRRWYEFTSRLSQKEYVGPIMRSVLNGVTSIPPLHPGRDLSKLNLSVRFQRFLIRRGLCRGVVEHVARNGIPLVTTFYSPALAADAAGCRDVSLLVTDTDLHRIWVAPNPAASRIRYFAPSQRAAKRLRAYGVRPELIRFTGFPLPHELVGGPRLPALRRNLAARIVRLDPKKQFQEASHEALEIFLGPLPREPEGQPPLLTVAIGGAGAQAGVVRSLIQGLRAHIDKDRIRLALVAGLRPEIADLFQGWTDEAGLSGKLGGSLWIVRSESMEDNFHAFNELLARTDILWTKPSELAFYAALGIPVVCTWPVGVHERYNRRWLIENGAGFKMHDPHFAGGWITEWLEDGTLAAAAWSGFLRLPKLGLYRILHEIGHKRLPKTGA